MDKSLPLLVMLTVVASGDNAVPLPPAESPAENLLGALGQAVRGQVAAIEASGIAIDRETQISQWYNWPNWMNTCVRGYWRNC